MFENFLKDMGNRPTPKHTLDRIDNDGDYTPENCRWATPTEQARNKRNTIFITYKDETKPLAEWAESLGMTWTSLYQRIKRHGWSIERALTQPVRK